MLGNADPSSVLPADFIVPTENAYIEPPPATSIELQSLVFSAVRDSLDTPPDEREIGLTGDVLKHKISTYTSAITFRASINGEDTEYSFSLNRDVYFVTAHPCAPSQYVKYVKSPSSPTIQQIDVSGVGMPGKVSTVASVTGTLHSSFHDANMSNISQDIRCTSSTPTPSSISRSSSAAAPRRWILCSGTPRHAVLPSRPPKRPTRGCWSLTA